MNHVKIMLSFMHPQGWIPGEEWFHLKINTPFPRQVLENMAIIYGENKIRCHIKFMGLFQITRLK
jgi:hypothetical protein